MVLIVTVVLLLLAAVAFRAGTSRDTLPSEESRLRALHYAESGLALAKARIYANEPLRSAAVSKDFGDGAKTYEVLRMPAGPSTSALVYLRIDDAADPDLELPAESVLVATAVAEYPVLVNRNGIELTDRVSERTRARRMLKATFRVPGRGERACASEGCGSTLRWWEIP